MSTTTDNGFRSKCCYAPLRVGRRKIKKTTLTVNVWVCCKCGKKDVGVVQYTKSGAPESTHSFAEEPEDS